MNRKYLLEWIVILIINVIMQGLFGLDDHMLVVSILGTIYIRQGFIMNKLEDKQKKNEEIQQQDSFI